MNKKFSKILTGFNFLDKNWGGVYPGGNYVIIGPKRSGKTLLMLKMIEHLATSNYSCLLLTPKRKKNLEIQASSLYFDLDEFTASGLITVEKINEKFSNFESIKEIVETTKPSIIFFDEITTVLDYSNAKELSVKYQKFVEYLEESDVTSIFSTSMPKVNNIKYIIQTIAKNSVGIVQLKSSSTSQNYLGSIIIKPNIGHIEGEFETTYKVEPIKGIVTEEKVNIANLINKGVDPNAMMRVINTERFSYSNIYPIDEFKIILESKKVYTKNTNVPVNILVYQIKDVRIETDKLTDILKRTLDRGDKISSSEAKVFVLLSDKSTKKLKRVLTKLDNIIRLEYNNIENLDDVLLRTTQVLKTNFTID
ncbi:MAG: ATPase domain-containing protein [Melioribacteraceae bacterium]